MKLNMRNHNVTTYGWTKRTCACLLPAFILHPSSLILRSFAALLLAGSIGGGRAAADATIAKVEVFPPDVHLNTNRDRQKFVVVATRADGVTQDVTGQAQVTLANPALAKLDAATLFPLTDGETTLNVAFGGFTVLPPALRKPHPAAPPTRFN